MDTSYVYILIKKRSAANEPFIVAVFFNEISVNTYMHLLGNVSIYRIERHEVKE